MSRAVLVLCASLLAFYGRPGLAAAEGVEPLYIGVLELAEEGDGAFIRQIRFAFIKDAQGWRAVSTQTTLPAEVIWQISFDGFALGEITSREREPTPIEGRYAHTHEILTELEEIPRIPVDSPKFVYREWQPTFRPLLMVSAPNTEDPDRWERTALNDAEKARAIAEFRKHVRMLRQCDKPETGSFKEIAYGDDEIEFPEAYRSKAGEIVFGAQLSPARSGCHIGDDENFVNHWFLLKPDGAAQFLGTRMTALESADVDGDGKSEWVFKTYRGTDQDGYVMFYEGLSRQVRVDWTY